MKIFNLFFLAVLISTTCILAQEDELNNRLEATNQVTGDRLQETNQGIGCRLQVVGSNQGADCRLQGTDDSNKTLPIAQGAKTTTNHELRTTNCDNSAGSLNCHLIRQGAEATKNYELRTTNCNNQDVNLDCYLMMNPAVEGAEGTIKKLIVGETRAPRSIESNHLGVIDKHSVNSSVECTTTNHQSSSSYVCSSDPELPSPAAAAESTAYSLQSIASIRSAGRIVPSSLTPLAQAEAKYKRAVSDHQKAMANFTAAHHHWAIAQNFPIRQLQVAQGDYESARINYNNIAQQAQWAHADYTGFQKIVQEALSSEVIWHVNAKNQEASYKQVFDDIHLKLGEANQNIETAKVRCDQAQVYPRSSDYLLWFKNSADQLAKAQHQVNKTATIMKSCNQKIVSCLLASNTQKTSDGQLATSIQPTDRIVTSEDKQSVTPSVECAKGLTNHQTSSNDVCYSELRLPSPSVAVESLTSHLPPPTTIRPVDRIVTNNVLEHIKEELVQKSRLEVPIQIPLHQTMQLTGSTSEPVAHLVQMPPPQEVEFEQLRLEEEFIPVKKKKMKRVPQTVAQHSINLPVEKEVIETNCVPLQPPSHLRSEASSEKNTDEFDAFDSTALDNEEEGGEANEEDITGEPMKQLCSKKKIKRQQQAKALKEKIAAKKTREAEWKALNEDIRVLHTKAEKADSESSIARKREGKDTSPETENSLLVEIILKEFHAEKIWKQLEKAYERGCDLVPESLKSSWMTKLQNAKMQNIRCYADGRWNSARKAANEALILRDQIAKKTTTQEWTIEEEEALWKKAALLEIRAMVVWDTFQQVEDDLKQLPEQWQIEARKRINYAKNQKQICDISVRWSSAKQLAALAVINRNEAKRVVDTENEEKNLLFNKAIDKAETTRKSFSDISNILTNILESSVCSISNTSALNSVSTQLTTAWPTSLWITYLADAQREENFWVAKKAEWILDKEKALQSHGTMTLSIEEIKMLDGDIAAQDSINPLGEYPNTTTNQQTFSNCAYSSGPLLPSSISNLPSPSAAAMYLAPIATMTLEDIQKTIHELEEKVEEAEVSANDAKKAALATDVDSEGMNRRLEDAILKARHAETLYTQLEAVYRRSCDVIPSAFQELWIEGKEHLLNNALEKKMDWDSVALFFNIKKIEQKVTCFTMQALRVTNHEQEADQASQLASIETEAVEAWDHFIEVHQSSLSQVPENLKERWHTKIKMAELKKTTCNIGVAFSRAHERSARTMIIKNQAMVASAAEKPALWDKAIEQAEETREALDQIIQTITTIQEKTPQNLSPCLSAYLKAAQHKKQFFISIIKEWKIKKEVSV